MQQVERPAAVLMAPLHDGFDGLMDAAVRRTSRVAEIIEAAQDIVAPERGKREAEPALVDDGAGPKRTQQATFEQVVLGSPASLRDGGRAAARPFVIAESFENADRGMEGRAPAGRGVAVPAAVFELLAQEPVGQRVVWLFEIRAEAEYSAVDAGLGFAVKKGPVIEALEHEPPVDAVDHAASLPRGGIEAQVFQHDESVEDDDQLAVLQRQIVPPAARAGAPFAVR